MYVDSPHSQAEKEKIPNRELTKGLGIWKFDRRKKERKYYSLSGRICKGSDAVSQAKLDAQNQGSSSRYELELLVDAARQNFCKLVSGTGTGAIAAGSEAESSFKQQQQQFIERPHESYGSKHSIGVGVAVVFRQF